MKNISRIFLEWNSGANRSLFALEFYEELAMTLQNIITLTVQSFLIMHLNQGKVSEVARVQDSSRAHTWSHAIVFSVFCPRSLLCLTPALALVFKLSE